MANGVLWKKPSFNVLKKIKHLRYWQASSSVSKLQKHVCAKWEMCLLGQLFWTETLKVLWNTVERTDEHVVKKITVQHVKVAHGMQLGGHIKRRVKVVKSSWPCFQERWLSYVLKNLDHSPVLPEAVHALRCTSLSHSDSPTDECCHFGDQV